MAEDLPGGWGPILEDLVERRRAARAGFRVSAYEGIVASAGDRQDHYRKGRRASKSTSDKDRTHGRARGKAHAESVIVHIPGDAMLRRCTFATRSRNAGLNSRPSMSAATRLMAQSRKGRCFSMPPVIIPSSSSVTATLPHRPPQLALMISEIEERARRRKFLPLKQQWNAWREQ